MNNYSKDKFKPSLLSKLSNDELINIIEHISNYYEEKLNGFAKFHDEKINDLIDKIEDLKQFNYIIDEEKKGIEEQYFDLMDQLTDLTEHYNNLTNEYNDLLTGSG